MHVKLRPVHSHPRAGQAAWPVPGDMRKCGQPRLTALVRTRRRGAPSGAPRKPSSVLRLGRLVKSGSFRVGAR
jgi:hypothetical protein